MTKMAEQGEVTKGNIGKQFAWTLSKVETVVDHLSSQDRFNCAYTGQYKGDMKYEEDVSYYNTQVSCFVACNVLRFADGFLPCSLSSSRSQPMRRPL